MTRLENLLIERINDCQTKFNLWTKDDPVIIGVSGGKDSLALYSILKKIHNKVYPVHIKNSLTSELNFSYLNEIKIIETDIYKESHLSTNGKNPCYICSRKRRKALLEYAQNIGVKKIILAHNKNDVAETLLLNMIYSREISTLKAKQEIFGGEYTILRPFFYVEDSLIKSYCKENNLVIQKNDCPESVNSKRAYIRDLITRLQADNPRIDIYDNLFSSLVRVKADFLPFEIWQEDKE